MSVYFASFCALWAQPEGPGRLPLKNWSVATESLKAQLAKVNQKLAQSGTVSAGVTLTFVAVPPCRVFDTRVGFGFTGAFGPPGLTAGQPRTIIVPQSNCGVPAAGAYSLNFAVVPPVGGVVGYLSAWAADQPLPNTAVLNDAQGGIANAPAIVAASANGSIRVQASDNTDLVIDLNGYYVARTAAEFRGAWSSTATYGPGDVVTAFAGVISSYVALSANQGSIPCTICSQMGSMGDFRARCNGAAGLDGASGTAGCAGASGSSRTFRAARANGPHWPPGNTGSARLLWRWF